MKGMVKIDHSLITTNIKPGAWFRAYCSSDCFLGIHDDVMKGKYFLRNWPFVWVIQRCPVNSPHKGQWREVLMFSLICVWMNDWVNNRETGDLRRYRAHLWRHCNGLQTYCTSIPVVQPGICNSPVCRYKGRYVNSRTASWQNKVSVITSFEGRDDNFQDVTNWMDNDIIDAAFLKVHL